MYEGKINKLEFGSHQKLLRLVGKNKNVLEVGCARGVVSEKLKENGCKVTAVEINKEMAAEARPKCDHVIRANFESDNLGLKPESFDIVLFADVLEHMGNPGKALQKARGLLKKEGRVVASIPNVANWKIRLMLLFGKFNYTDQGILDKTHVHFYTVKTAKKLVLENGFELEKMDFVPSFPFPNPWQIRVINLGKQFIAGILPGVFSFQILMVAKKT